MYYKYSKNEIATEVKEIKTPTATVVKEINTATVVKEVKTPTKPDYKKVNDNRLI